MAEEVIRALREKHAKPQHAGSERGAKTTLGIILEGTRVSMVVPASPAYRPRKGKRVERDDEIVEIDGAGVKKEVVLKQLRGSDEIGTLVDVKLRRADHVEKVTLVRACMEQVIELKDLFLAMAELKANAERKAPDLNENIRLISVVEKQLARIDDVREDTENRLRSHIVDLEISFREATDKLQESLKRAEDNYQEAMSTNAKLTKEMVRLKETTQQELELCTADNQSLKSEIIQLQALVDQLSDGLQQKSEMQDSFIHDMQEQVLDEFQQIEEQISKVEEVLSKTDRTIELLNVEVRQLQQNAIEGTRLRRKREEELERREEELKSMSQQFKDTLEQLKNAEASIQDREEEASRLQEAMKDKEEEASRLQEAMKEKEEEASRLQEAMKEKEEEASRLQEVLFDDMKRNLTVLIETAKHMRKDAEEIRKETEERNAEASRWRTRAEWLQSEHRELTKELQEARINLKAMANESAQMQAELRAEMVRMKETHEKELRESLDQHDKDKQQLVSQLRFDLQGMEREAFEGRRVKEELEEIIRLRGIERIEHNYLKAEYHRWFKEVKKCKSEISLACSEIDKLAHDTIKENKRSESVLQEHSNASSKVKFLEKKIFELETEKKSREARLSVKPQGHYSDDRYMLKAALDASTEALEECHTSNVLLFEELKLLKSRLGTEVSISYAKRAPLTRHVAMEGSWR